MLNYFNNPRMAEVVYKIIQHFIPIRQTGIYTDLDSSFSFVNIFGLIKVPNSVLTEKAFPAEKAPTTSSLYVLPPHAESGH